MLTRKEYQKLGLEAKKLAGEDFDKLNFRHELIDSSISYYENKNIIRNKISKLLGKTENPTKAYFTSQKEMADFCNQKQLEEAEKQAEERFLKSLEQIENSKNTDFLEKQFFMIKQFAKMVGMEKATAFLCEGSAGIGKTFNCIKALQEINRKFIVISSFLTPLELFTLLYQYKQGYTIIFDDCSIFENRYNQSILKSATFSSTGVRIMRYLSSTPKLKVPSVFDFESTIIFCVNKLNKLNEDFRAVLDRCIYFKLELSLKEKLKIIAELSKLPYKNFSDKEKQEVFNFIKDNVDETCDINLRTLYKIYSFYDFDKKNWRELAGEVIKPNEELKLIKELLNKNSSVKNACQEYIDLGYGSRASFFRQKRKIYKE